MVRAAQKGELEDPSPEVADVADDISVKDAKKFAKTKHKGLPEKKMKKESVDEGKKFSELSTQRKPGEKKKPKKKREGYIFDASQPPSKKVQKESFQSWRKKASEAMKRVSKKKEEKKPQMDATTKKLHKWRKDKEHAEREKYVSPFRPIGDD